MRETLSFRLCSSGGRPFSARTISTLPPPMSRMSVAWPGPSGHGAVIDLARAQSVVRGSSSVLAPAAKVVVYRLGPLHAEIVVVGRELLRGQLRDGNASWIAGELTRREALTRGTVKKRAIRAWSWI